MSKSVLEGRSYYKPFQYPWAYDCYKKSEQMHWLPEEVEFRDDIRDWKENLSVEEKNLLTQLFRFFTQADIDVASGYRTIFGPKFGNHPELAMMMSSFAAREAVHVDAYSTLIETVGLPDTTYSAFVDYEAMAEKHDYMNNLKLKEPEDLLTALAVYSAFGEGMQLFSSFAILMNFERFNKMKGMCNIVRWSIRDESLHVEGMTRLFREIKDDLIPSDLDPETRTRKREDVISKIYTNALQMVILEDKFIDLCFEQGGIEGITPDEVKSYIRYIANKRWHQLGFKETIFDDKNPFDWLDWVVNGKEHTNFFEARPTEYSKGTVQESEEMVW